MDLTVKLQILTPPLHFFFCRYLYLLGLFDVCVHAVGLGVWLSWLWPMMVVMESGGWGLRGVGGVADIRMGQFRL